MSVAKLTAYQTESLSIEALIMMIKYNKTNITYSMVDLDIKFPYYAWYNSRKDSICKLDIVYAYNKPSCIQAIEITSSFSFSPSIKTKKFNITPDFVVGDELDSYIKDYHVETTETEFNKFKDDVLLEIFKTVQIEDLFKK